MITESKMIKCAIMRGGTSKAIFLKKTDLPQNEKIRDRVISKIFGGADPRQIDGLGGADVLTSKLAIIGPPTLEGADVDYTFGQVSFETDFIDYNGLCGNISSAVGPFAIDEGMVTVTEPITKVRINMKNCEKMLIAEVPVKDGKAMVTGDFSIDGCPGTGAKIVLDWSQGVGAITGKVLPTGNVRDVVEVDGKTFDVSIVDAGSVLVYVHAQDLGMHGTETVEEIEGDPALMELIEKIRGTVAIKIGLATTLEEATLKSPYNPFFAIVSKPKAYKTKNKKEVKAEDIDIVSRLLFMLRMHKTHPVSGTVSMGAAARIPGSIVYDLLSEESRAKKTLHIGHPGGIIPVESDATVNEDGTVKFNRIAVDRTARRLMDGITYVKNEFFEEE